MGKLLDITAAMAECKKRQDDRDDILLDAYYREQPKK